MTTTAPRRRTLLVVGVLAASLAAAVLAAGGPADEARLDAVAERGAQVMPFDLDATTHRFQPDEDGGTQVVVADDPGDAEQVRLIRAHLSDEAEAFARGDFDDPSAIHGKSMPGLAVLRESAGRIQVGYRPRPDGAEIGYVSGAPRVVDALHAWFAAQTSDHGAHAE